MFTLLRKVTVALRNTTPRRFFLSEAYKCEEAWGQRFESPLLKQINPNSMFYELQNKFENEGVVSAVDIDLFVNKITDPEQGEEILQLIQQLRLTAETSSTLDSTHHAVIRYLLKNDYKEDLLEILHNRLDYGIFPDHYCFNVLMDTYIEQKDFVSASKVASLLMLQEDSDHPLSNAFCIYSCHKYLENPEPWQIEIEKIEEPEEEVKVRVRYLANPYFDDHFDLIESSDLVGKTLVFQGKRLDNALGRSLHLRGLMLYKKYQVAEKLIDDWLKKDTKDIVYSEILDIIQKDNINITGDAVTDEYKKILEQLNSLRKCELHPGSINEAIETQLRSAIDQYSEEDITKQIQAFKDWEEKRMLVLEEQKQLIDRRARLAKVELIKKELIEKERILTFFDKEEEIELEIERKKLLDKQRIQKAKNAGSKPLLDNPYVPPEALNTVKY